MDENIVIRLAEPGTFVDGLTDVLRNGARKLLTQAIEAEVADFLGRYSDLVTEKGGQRVVRHGQLPEREIMTGIGPVRCALSGFAIAPAKIAQPLFVDDLVALRAPNEEPRGLDTDALREGCLER
jgi:hypothetical protein